MLKQNYKKLLQLVRQHNPKAKIVFLSGSMLYNKELQQVKQLLDEVAAEAKKAIAEAKKKAAEEANAKYNQMLYYGLGTEETD